ncbi:fluoride efflux transporter CrcB [Patulibacter sp. SYSU D01012]|uniref:fluoride efflux transporter CrcB n=1 Tax=Patulibacter sp. SYSU D01012 TaxID=2817381 RepID=UPI0032C02C80
MPAAPPTAPDARAARVGVVAAVFCGGALGTVARAALGEALPHAPGAWPWATFAVNVAGALLLGWWSTRIAATPDVDPRWRPFLATGVCGGLTTFSTLQVDVVQQVRADAWGLAAGYAATTLAAGLLAVVVGRAVAARVAAARLGAGGRL